MSHFTRLKQAKITDRNYLLKALNDLGYSTRGRGLVRGFLGALTHAEIRIKPSPDSYEIGFRKGGESYVCIADWYGVHELKQEKFLRKLNQQYAVVAAKDRLAAQGFCLAQEKEIDGRIHLVLRRAA
jgi:Protein of unknown function (DUF1257)